MYYVIKSVIGAGSYKLSEIRHKVKKMYLLGDLTEEQLDELLALAVGGAAPEGERPELLTTLQRLSARMDILAAQVAALGGSAEEEEAYPVWVSWDGISSNYQPGAIVSHKGNLWRSVYSGQNVWEPGTVPETFWEVYQEE